MGVGYWALVVGAVLGLCAPAFGQSSPVPGEITRTFAALEKLRPVKTKIVLTGTDNGGEFTLRRRGREELFIFSVGLSNRFVDDWYYCRNNRLTAYRRVETRLMGVETPRTPTLGKPRVLRTLWLTPSGAVHQSIASTEKGPSWASAKDDYLALTTALRAPGNEADLTERITGK